MNIQYYGDYCFKISTKPAGRATEDVVILTDPLGKGAGLRSPQGQADIVLLTHGDFSGIRGDLKGEPVVLDAPGEYAVKGVSVQGLATFRDDSSGTRLGQNTLFVFESEDIHCAFLGALGHDLLPEWLDRLNGVDILFIPVGSAETLSAKTGAELARKIEPAVIIPMHYAVPGLTLSLDSEQAFCGAVGNCPHERPAKYNIKKKDIEGKQLEIVLLDTGK